MRTIELRKPLRIIVHDMCISYQPRTCVSNRPSCPYFTDKRKHFGGVRNGISGPMVMRRVLKFSSFHSGHSYFHQMIGDELRLKQWQCSGCTVIRERLAEREWRGHFFMAGNLFVIGFSHHETSNFIGCEVMVKL